MTIVVIMLYLWELLQPFILNAMLYQYCFLITASFSMGFPDCLQAMIR